MGGGQYREEHGGVGYNVEWRRRGWTVGDDTEWRRLGAGDRVGIGRGCYCARFTAADLETCTFDDLPPRVVELNVELRLRGKRTGRPLSLWLGPPAAGTNLVRFMSRSTMYRRITKLSRRYEPTAHAPRNSLTSPSRRRLPSCCRSCPFPHVILSPLLPSHPHFSPHLLWYLSPDVEHREESSLSEGGREGQGQNAPPQSKALRLLCNGFEVLTERLATKAEGHNDSTLASVGWVQAGVLSPSKGTGECLLHSLLQLFPPPRSRCF